MEYCVVQRRNNRCTHDNAIPYTILPLYRIHKAPKSEDFGAFPFSPQEELSKNPQPPLDCFLPIVYDYTKHLTEGVSTTDTNRMKKAAEWFYSTVFREESIRPRAEQPRERLPAALLAARSLESGLGARDSRSSLFLKQAKLLEFYSDDYPFDKSVVCYYPTYQALSDTELRGYFSWRTKLRSGDLQKTSLSFAFLYIYELLNQIGVTDPLDGYEKLLRFHKDYGALDGKILPYLNQWLYEYAAYYELEPGLLCATPQVIFDNHVAVLEDVQTQEPGNIVAAVKYFTKWLDRSRFYAEHREDMDQVIVRVLRKVSDHYAHCKNTMIQQYFGKPLELFSAPFSTAVFCHREKSRDREYRLSRYTLYRCRNGFWTLYRLDIHQRPNTRINQLIKTIDSLMRQEYGYGHPVKCETDTKWLLKLIGEEIRGLSAEKEAAKAKLITIDYSRLSAIRSDAALTRDKLTVEDELEPEDPVKPEEPRKPEESQTPDTPLDSAQYRLLRCLLYGGDLGWVSSEGHLLSVLVDGINEKLYDSFADSVLELNDRPEIVEDYIDELKEMVRP